MKITFLGTGAMSVVGKRNPTSIVLEANKQIFVFDCGFGSLVEMAKKGIDFMKIKAIFISHTHTDHVSDLLPIVHAMAVKSDFEPKKARKEPLEFFGPKDLPKLYKVLRKFQFPDKLENFKIKVEGFAGKKKTYKNVEVESMVVDHSVGWISQALAYKISSGKKTIVYSGDIDWTENIDKFIEFAKDADVLIIDGGKPIGKKGGCHLEPFQVSQIALKANVKTLVISHQNEINSPSEVHDAVAEFYKGDILIAKDGMELEV